ncbi:MAG: chromosome segregation protein SMC [Rhodospirillaceae bacterium]|nr:chromosome segregation protein SMC [Rhodospirillaceae bacterium]
MSSCPKGPQPSVQFARLRLQGFKSFVEPTELVIEPGITGIVGPNGCGKSNLVEALRWVMGENSARRLRGQEMDDVIFGGTSDRPARNLAEVVLSLDNADRSAPPAYDLCETVEVSRRIERGVGSDFRINGRSVRARDVQLLFQDSGSGPGSAALVSQGRVAVLIGARPAERRLLLEEAAGIIGVHSRRQEAEQRLRAAEDNLQRLDDVILAMQQQEGSLRKQARQATRYRTVSETIRKTDAALLRLRWAAAAAEREAARAALAQREAAVADHTREAAAAAREAADASAALPALRQAEAEAATRLRALAAERERLDREAERIAERQGEIERQLRQIAADLEREAALKREADGALARLAEEQAALTAAAAQDSGTEAEAARILAEADTALAADEARLQALTEAVAAAEAERRAAARRVGELQRRLAEIEHRLGQARAERDREQAVDPGDVQAAARALDTAEAALAAAQGDLEASEEAQEAARVAEAEAAARHRDAEAALSRLLAEADGLQKALAGAVGGKAGADASLAAGMRVTPGYEAAVSAALRDDLEASTRTDAPAHWRALPPIEAPQALPSGAEPLSAVVTGPEAAARRLGHIGLVADRAAGDALLPHLQPGQELVSRDGGLWRWDGYVAAPGAPSPAAVRLAQRNRLEALTHEIAAARTQSAEAADRLAPAAALSRQLREAVTGARQAVAHAFRAAGDARTRRTQLEEAAGRHRSRLEALASRLSGLDADRQAAADALAAAQASEAALGDETALREQAQTARGAVAERRGAAVAARAALDTVRREAAARRRRLEAIAHEAETWRARTATADGRLADLQARQAAAREEAGGLAQRPAELAAERGRLFDRLAEAEAALRGQSDHLAVAETRQATADREAKAAEARLVEAREARVRAEAALAAAETAVATVEARIRERLGADADPAVAEAASGDVPGDADEAAIEARLARLMREREAMGPVNLRAEVELQELSQQIEGLISERADLTAAIDRLRHGIASLNKEARERLINSFELVNGHFRHLFMRLFGGGQAHLKLVDADDPLNAGLEVFASPPGKRLQHLSLLSGGEQALTAIALIFAVFLTNPTPICVLDEVDAPLDDANVDRFCRLLDELGGEGTTRFLVITHHRMTMARVDRLFGVTMPERGLSQLVSVSLDHAEQLVRRRRGETAAPQGATVTNAGVQA